MQTPAAVQVSIGLDEVNVIAGTERLLQQWTAAVAASTYSADGIYSNAGVDFTMTGATDNGISFSAAVNIDAGT